VRILKQWGKPPVKDNVHSFNNHTSLTRDSRRQLSCVSPGAKSNVKTSLPSLIKFAGTGNGGRLLQGHFHKLTGLERGDFGRNFISQAPKRWPVVGRQDQNRKFSSGDVLLVFEALIAGEKGVEPRLDGLQQGTVLQLSPAHFLRGLDGVIGKKLA
jgi:hypothetical protein